MMWVWGSEASQQAQMQEDFLTIAVTFGQHGDAVTNTTHVDGSVHVLGCGTRLVCSFSGTRIAMNVT